MSQQIVTFPAFTVKGLSVSSRNSDEMNPDTAKIGQLWRDFFGRDLISSIPNREPSTPIYGVYNNYESNQHGAFDLTAGVRILNTEAADAEDVALDAINSDLSVVTVEAGEYMAFETQGSMPQRIIDGWAQVWTYFEKGDSSYKRRFSSDFEQYVDESNVVIYVAVEKKATSR
ncbi:GyrI-like domain-containing protein [Hydromonas duriensis]|uniref:Putative transcriptional regulator YdeE n=1 Tax=Hydromonas duriensis TaxID=1527608 RepID=A0A4R6Y6M1_9BURK|nr:GyrI-like domain-containing protein [Hydromonas duriensis]TDR30731.1 putative transcriptional regulator YdeE [Hydromonas duriensis]